MTRRFLLTAHIVLSVGWIGAIASFLGLSLVGLTSDDAELVRSVYRASEPLTELVVVPLAVASLATGLIQSLATQWGLIRHYWVIVKLAITVLAVLVLLLYTQTVDQVAGTAAAGADLATMRSPSYVLHSGVAIVLLLLASVLAVYKPRGVTRYGWRRQQRLAAARELGARRPTGRQT